MRKFIALAAALAAVTSVAPAAAKHTPNGPKKPPPGQAKSHGSGSTNANTACRKLRHDLGTATFRQTYGTNHNGANAMGRCRSAERKANKAAKANAAKTCKAEQAADPAAFAAKYGKGDKGNGAFGACVSQAVHAAAVKRHTAIVNAAKSCKTERAKDPAAFKTKYGTGKRHANAFGKCVSATAKAKHA